MRRAVPLLAFIGLAVLPAAPGAHPHAFVETEMTLTVHDGAVTAVDLTWTYDDFTSLLILTDMGLDPDGDGALTDAELDTLRGFDTRDWPDDFEGDLYLEADGAAVPLGDPVPTAIAVEDGLIVASHRRSVPAVPAEDLRLRQFDPTYYIAYTLRAPVAVDGPCAADVIPHDPDAAARAVERELNTIPEDIFEVMKIGHLYADSVRLTCNASS